MLFLLVLDLLHPENHRDESLDEYSRSVALPLLCKSLWSINQCSIDFCTMFLNSYEIQNDFQMFDLMVHCKPGQYWLYLVSIVFVPSSEQSIRLADLKKRHVDSTHSEHWRSNSV